jgi:hypothetical protein
MSQRPRVTELEREENRFDGMYKGHEIRIQRDDDRQDWYIAVRDQGGYYVYDGYWRDSSDKSLDDAIIEACQGAMLWEPAIRQDGGN